MKNKFSNLSLEVKLILSYIIIIVIPIIIFAVIQFRNFEARNITDALNKSNYALEIEVANIEKKKETIESTARMITGNSELMNYINAFDKLDVRKLVEFNQNTYRNIMQLQYSNPSISEINIFLKSKNVTEIWPLIIDENRIKNKIWYKEIQKNNYNDYWDLNFRNESTFDIKFDPIKSFSDQVALCKTIYYTRNKMLGILRVNMLAKDFFSKAYSNVSDSDNQMYIIDGKGGIFTNKKSAFLTKTQINKELIKNAFDKNFSSKRNSFTVNIGKKHLIMVCRKIQDLNCYVISVTSIEPMLDYINNTRNVSILGILFLISILFALTYFTTTKILKKLYLIIQSMKKIQKGDFNIEIPVRGNDEIGELAHNFRKMLGKINELISEAAEKKATTKEAELRALKTQIDSHFIYNVLENIKMMAEIEGQYLISDSLTSLGAMMRYNLRWRGEYVSLEDELEHISNYIKLMNIRFDNRLDLKLNIEEALMKEDILKMSLQPLVENAVKHGLSPIIEERRGEISINAVSEDKNIVITIYDNGIGMEESELGIVNGVISAKCLNESEANYRQADTKVQKNSTGIGLKNVNERLKLYYGEKASIEVFGIKEMYTKVVMKIPY